MKLFEANPFLRFVSALHYAPKREFLKAVDYHFYFMQSDRCVMDIENTTHVLNYGSVVLLPPDTAYRFDTEEKLSFISINFDYTQSFSHLVKEVIPTPADGFLSTSVTESSVFEDEPFLNAPLVLHDMGYLSDRLQSILHEHTYKKQYFKEVSSTQFKGILYELVRHFFWQGKENHNINPILDYIHQHYAEPLTNNDLAAMAGYHPYHLNRLMKQATGTTLRQYLINYRMTAARQYLRETQLPIAKVAELCGYNNFSNFSTDFKQKYAMTPMCYRKESRNA